MSASFRRLASDQASLRRNALPPNYLFPAGQENEILPEDLTQLTILLTGPCGTPYTEGLWRLHLRIPTDYPRSPPKAIFKTRIWHPNVDESTGMVCLETLKRDWDPKLTLRDILVTISCLLVHPNPDSALNSAAGALLQDSYDSFAAQARLMASIHARTPADMRQAVEEARRRGEVAEDVTSGGKTRPSLPLGRRRMGHELRLTAFPQPQFSTANENDSTESDDENDHDPHKENDPSQSPTPVVQSPLSPRKRVLGKRPLSELPIPTSSDSEDGMTASEKNIAVNVSIHEATTLSDEPARKCAKIARKSSVDSPFSSHSSIWMDSPVSWVDEKENIMATATKESTPSFMQPPPRPKPGVQKSSGMVGSSALNRSKANKPRLGIRRI